MRKTAPPKSPTPKIPSLDEIQKVLCEKSLHEFVKAAWHQVEPESQAFQDNWHIGAICEHLEAVTTGQIRNLIINILHAI